MTRNYIKINNNGQGLIEALIAISIILAAIISTLTLIISSINAGRVSTDKLIAASLAREGIEIVRNIRDSNWIDPSGVNWDDGIIDIISANMPTAIPIIDGISPYQLNFLVGNFGDNCTPGNKCTRIYQKDNLYLQKYNAPDSGWQATKFYRLLYIDRICWSIDANGNETEAIMTGGSNCNSGYDLVGVKVISEVRWPTSNSINNVKIEERIYDWRP